MIQTKKDKVIWFVLMHVAFLFLTSQGIFVKMATSEGVELLSNTFILYMALAILMLAVYAVFWQQILKRMPLVTAYCNKPVTIFWAFLFGALIFQERLSWNMLLGAAVVVVGIYLVVIGDKKLSDNSKSNIQTEENK